MLFALASGTWNEQVAINKLDGTGLRFVKSHGNSSSISLRSAPFLMPPHCVLTTV